LTTSPDLSSTVNTTSSKELRTLVHTASNTKFCELLTACLLELEVRLDYTAIEHDEHVDLESAIDVLLEMSTTITTGSSE
jgi:hypothetical protein